MQKTVRVLLAVLCMVIICVPLLAAAEEEPVNEEPVVIAEEPEEMHEQEVIEAPAAYRDVVMLAKIMQAEAGVDWPDWAVMCIGEVVLNRVQSTQWPDSVRGVLYQAGPPIQYEPVWSSGWEEMEPEDRYMDLAKRLLDGERPIGDEDMVWQALFAQGEQTLVTYYDEVLGTTTYFCK